MPETLGSQKLLSVAYFAPSGQADELAVLLFSHWVDDRMSNWFEPELMKLLNGDEPAEVFDCLELSVSNETASYQFGVYVLASTEVDRDALRQLLQQFEDEVHKLMQDLFAPERKFCVDPDGDAEIVVVAIVSPEVDGIPLPFVGTNGRLRTLDDLPLH